MSDQEEIARAHAGAVLGRGIWPDTWSPGQQEDYLHKEGSWGDLWQIGHHGRVPGGPGEYLCSAGYRVVADGKWTAAVVLASLSSKEPSPELLACASALLLGESPPVVSKERG